MATVLPFDPNPRRRTPVAPLRRPVDGERPAAVERVVPLPTHREIAIERPAVRPSVRATVVAGREVAERAAVDPTPLTDRALAMRFFPLVGAVAAIDLWTKQLAVASLADRTIEVADTLALHLVYNTASVGGVWLGAYTRELNVAATGIVIGLLVMLAPVLSRLDRRAWLALGLMAGGGVGNLASLIGSTRGVVDFLAFRHTGGAWVLNVADVFMFAGLALLGRTILVLARAARDEHVARALPAR